jgi:hypothetical protein
MPTGSRAAPVSSILNRPSSFVRATPSDFHVDAREDFRVLVLGILVELAVRELAGDHLLRIGLVREQVDAAVIRRR